MRTSKRPTGSSVSNNSTSRPKDIFYGWRRIKVTIAVDAGEIKIEICVRENGEKPLDTWRVVDVPKTVTAGTKKTSVEYPKPGETLELKDWYVKLSGEGSISFYDVGTSLF